MKKNLVGRKEECSVLQALRDSERPEFLALYGRRRVGKTFLIREFFKHTGDIFFNVTGSKEGKLKEQINHFTEQLATVFLGGIKPQPGKNWDETFKILTGAIAASPSDKKIILFFDELPWMASKNSRLLQSLDYYWNQHWSDNSRIKLIICGSSASWIINKVIKNRGGLHNRITRKMHLEPFDLVNTKLFLKHYGVNLNNTQVAQLYMVTGGVPYYLSYVEKNLSSAQIIEKLAFSKDGILLDEFDNLFASLFNDHAVYIDIIRLISQFQDGIAQTDLLKKIGKSQIGGRGLDKLQALEDTGFIIGFTPHFNKRKGKFYKLIDEYTLFYMRWIEPVRSSLQMQSLDDGNWQEIQDSPAWTSWQGYAFEAVCYKHISQIRKKLSVRPTAIANSWRYVSKDESRPGAQIDLLFDRRDNAITLCEIKYSNKSFVIDKQYAKNIMNKQKAFVRETKTKKQIFFAMVCAGGLKDNIYSDDLIQGVVTLDDLFKE